MSNSELDNHLRKFYAEARTKDGQSYSRSSLLCLRNSIERHLNNPPFNRGIKFVKNPEFQQSNQMLNSKLKVQKQEGKENVSHKPVIESGDLIKLRSSTALRGNTALGLLRNVWFHVVLYWCRRGVEGLRNLKSESFTFCKDDEGREYVTMAHDEATKNHPGGAADIESFEKHGRMYKSSEDPNLDGISCLKRFLTKRNPRCSAFFQYPKRKFLESDDTWYDNKPLGINKLSTMMKEISSEANLSKIYTNHSVRATAITLWSDANVPSRHIMNISGHRNEQSIKNYNSRPSSKQLHKCSEILTTALEPRKADQQVNNDDVPQLPLQMAPDLSPQHTSTVENNASSFANVLAPGSLFNSCYIENIHVVVQQQSGFN